MSAVVCLACACPADLKNPDWLCPNCGNGFVRLALDHGEEWKP